LRVAGYDVKEVSAISPGAADEKVIEFAVYDSLVLLTEDIAKGDSCPIPDKRPKDVSVSVVEFVEKNSDKIEDCFVVIQPGCIRISERER